MMERSVLDAMQSILAGVVVVPSQQRDALLACLDLAAPGDEYAQGLRLILEDRDTPSSLAEFRTVFSLARAQLLAGPVDPAT